MTTGLMAVRSMAPAASSTTACSWDRSSSRAMGSEAEPVRRRPARPSTPAVAASTSTVRVPLRATEADDPAGIHTVVSRSSTRAGPESTWPGRSTVPSCTGTRTQPREPRPTRTRRDPATGAAVPARTGRSRPLVTGGFTVGTTPTARRVTSSTGAPSIIEPAP